MSGYLGLVTSEHRNRPRFMATVAAVTDPLCGLQELLETMRAAFDVDSAVGGQLDRTGEWIGRSRHLRLELDDVYFEWGREAVGWARGSWKGLYDPETEARLEQERQEYIVAHRQWKAKQQPLAV